VKIVRNSITGILIIVVAILAYVSFLLTTNYASQTNLQQTILEQFRSENSWRAALVSYFFNDRRQDMLNLASSREIDVFFENRALGMSMEYGLRQSLPPIKERFTTLLGLHRINEDAVYQQIVLLDETGRLLVTASAPGQNRTLPTDMKQLKEPDHRSGAVIADDQNRAILVSTAYFFKGRYSGQLIAWINPYYITHYIIVPQDRSERKTILAENTKKTSFPAVSWPLADVMDRSKGLPTWFEEKGPERTQRSMIGLSIPVNDTPFSLVTVAPANAVLGRLDPRGLLVGMGILAIVIISGGIYIMRTMTRSLLLRARLEASLEHEQEVRGKNLQLEKEIAVRKRAEEAVRESEEKYRQLFNSIRDALLITDNERTIIDCNPAFTTLFGYTLDEIEGRRTSVLFAHHEQFSHLGEALKTHSGNNPLIYPLDYKKKNGEIFPGEVALSFFTDNRGRTRGLIGLIKDVTERKRAEEEKRSLEEERQKSHKLEAIGTLAGGIAHDFNNLLQGVFGYISMAMLKIEQKEESLTLLRQAEKALHMSVNLTTQLLTFAKGGKPVKKKIAPGPVIENAVKFALSGSSTDYRLTLDKDLGTVEADEGQIGQVIQNIVLNADQAMPEGGTIEITAQNIHAPQKDVPHLLQKGDYVKIAVQDSGIGIAKQYLQKIFDPYFTTKEKGSGLGLATSYSIIRNHGGVIDVTSEIGKGSSFFIYLPRVESERDVVEALTVSPAVRKGKILVMDDDEMIRDISGAMIKVAGHEVDLAEDGKTAIEKYRAARDSGHPFDVVILDLTVRGGMGGKETVERLRSIDPGVKAIVSSGYSDDAVVSDYRKYGFLARLIKPYKQKELRDALIALLSS
jgi:PAS domain S-box-containing protein